MVLEFLIVTSLQNRWAIHNNHWAIGMLRFSNTISEIKSSYAFARQLEEIRVGVLWYIFYGVLRIPINSEVARSFCKIRIWFVCESAL